MQSSGFDGPVFYPVGVGACLVWLNKFYLLFQVFEGLKSEIL